MFCVLAELKTEQLHNLHQQFCCSALLYDCYQINFIFNSPRPFYPWHMHREGIPGKHHHSH